MTFHLGGQPSQQHHGGGAGEPNAAIRGMTGDQVHRIVGQEPVHRGSLCCGLVGGALAILGCRRDQHRLDQRRQYRHGIDFPYRGRETRNRQSAKGFDPRDDQKGRTRRQAGPDHRGAAADQGRFRRHQREPHHQRRQNPATQCRQITDQNGKDRQSHLFQNGQRKTGHGQKGQKGRRQQTSQGHSFRSIGATDQADKGQDQSQADRRLGGLHCHEQPAQRLRVAGRETGRRNMFLNRH